MTPPGWSACRRAAAAQQRIALSLFHDTATPEIYTLSLHDALPISRRILVAVTTRTDGGSEHLFLYTASRRLTVSRSEEHTSELQSRFDLVCRLLLEKKKVHGDAAAKRYPLAVETTRTAMAQ